MEQHPRQQQLDEQYHERTLVYFQGHNTEPYYDYVTYPWPVAPTDPPGGASRVVAPLNSPLAPSLRTFAMYVSEGKEVPAAADAKNNAVAQSPVASDPATPVALT